MLDFGGQYCHLISRRIRDLLVYSKVMSADTKAEDLRNMTGLKGIILSGGARSVYDKDSPICAEEIFEIGVPVFGICYGHQMIAHIFGGTVKPGDSGEYGLTEVKVKEDSVLLNGCDNILKVWMNHKDIVTEIPADKGFRVTAYTDHSPVAAFENSEKRLYGAQFHPEVTHTEKGNVILGNFALSICNAKKEWNASNVIDHMKTEIKEKIGDSKAIIGLSGGIDSSVAALITSSVIGKQLTAVYVDTGLMRKDETEFIRQAFSNLDLNLKIIDASERFFRELKGVSDPEKKRKIIGRLFIEVFDEVAIKTGAKILLQGTIYSDRIESGMTKYSSTIKSHHNVSGLPEDMKLTVYEPLRNLYKDEVRNIAKMIGVPHELLKRQVFPGPGLGIRVVGEIDENKVRIVREANNIVEEELKTSGIYDRIWMGFAVLLPVKSVGIQGDARSYKYPIVIRIIESEDAMTANFAKIDYDILEKMSTRITNEIPEVNRVVYDISNKPPATMEWE